MIYVLFLDDGHGMKTSGKRTPYISSIGRYIPENEFNRAVVKLMKEQAEKLGFIVFEVAPTDEDTPLKTRTDFANAKLKELQAKHGRENVKAVYISVHYDALDGKFDGEGKDPEGLTVFVYTGNINKESGKLAKSVNKYLAQGTPQKNRGVKEANLHVVRETNMPAILTENGFMDNMREALLMIDTNFQKEVATEHMKGICEYFNVKFVTPTVPAKPSTPAPTTTGEYKVRIKLGELNYRAGAGINHPVKGKVFKDQVFTITSTVNGWGKLKSGAGWINVSSTYVTKL